MKKRLSTLILAVFLCTTVLFDFFGAFNNVNVFAQGRKSKITAVKKTAKNKRKIKSKRNIKRLKNIKKVNKVKKTSDKKTRINNVSNVIKDSDKDKQNINSQKETKNDTKVLTVDEGINGAINYIKISQAKDDWDLMALKFSGFDSGSIDKIINEQISYFLSLENT